MVDNASRKLKHRLARMLLRSSCTTSSINDSTTAFITFSQNNHEPASPSFRPRPARAGPVVQVSIDCGGGIRRSSHGAPGRSSSLPSPASEDKKKNSLQGRKDWEGRKCSCAWPSPALSNKHHLHYYDSCSNLRRQRRKEMAKAKPTRRGVTKNQKTPNTFGYSSSSSAGSDNELGLFSSDSEGGEEEETRTLFSSLSFSSDSSGFYHRASSASSKKMKKKKSCCLPPRSRGNKGLSVSSAAAAAAAAETGLPVVKRSSNPHADFRMSMAEMIVEGRMSSTEEMERLLGSYLALNSARHHPAILKAFEDIYEAIFCD